MILLEPRRSPRSLAEISALHKVIRRQPGAVTGATITKS
jgi:hypothetical protein